jgi:opacity protein-like surface antigen
MKKFLIIATLALLSTSAMAADLAVKATPLPAARMPCAAGDCSGWYAGFGILGDGTNVDIVGNGINGSVFAAGGALKVQGGYQLWNGAWFAAIDGSLGYEFSRASSSNLPIVNNFGSKFIGTELIKLGYNFFPSSQSALTTPSQSPIQLVSPANLMAASTPYLTFGGMQRRGKNEWVSGAGIQTIIAAGWSSDVKYLYAPSQEGNPATNIVMIELNKHF